MFEYNKSLKQYSRELRNNSTIAERKFWNKVRSKQFKNYQFYRQRIIGNYIVDFYCPKLKLVVELDGGHHYEEDKKELDLIRDSYIESMGFKLLRYSNFEIMSNIDGVISDIEEKIRSWKY